MIDTILKSLDLPDDAIDLYKRILEGGSTSAGQLARVSGMARATVYDHLGKLADKGLIRQSQHRGVKNYAAEPVKNITALLDRKIERLNKSKEEFDRMLPLLETQQAAHFISPRFQMFDGPEAVKNILNDMLLYRDIETRSFWPISVLVEALSGEFFQQHNARRIENNISVKAIWPQRRTVDFKQHDYLGSGKAHLRQIRIAPLEVDFTMGYWIYGSRIAFLSSQKEAFGMIIESRELVEMMTVQHDIIWRLSTPIEKAMN